MKKEDISIFTKLLLKHWPTLAMRLFAKKMGIKNIIFDKAHEALFKTERIDFFPTIGGRGLIMVIDGKTALFFYQEGDHFVYDGYEMGKYNKGDVTVFDGIRKDVSMYP